MTVSTTVVLDGVSGEPEELVSEGPESEELVSEGPESVGDAEHRVLSGS
jgi:hypothetical protein